MLALIFIGNNLAKVRKCLEDNYNFKIAIQLLVLPPFSYSFLRLRCSMPSKKFTTEALSIET